MNLRLFLIYVFCITVFAMRITAQDTAPGDTAARDSINLKWGPDKANSLYFFGGAEMIVGEPDGPGADIVYGRSLLGTCGFRYKRKICELWSTGGDLSFITWNYALRQTKYKILPNNILHNKERLSLGALDLAWYNRLCFGRNGSRNHGYLDIGIFGGYFITRQHFTRDKLDTADVNNAGQVDVTNRRLIYPVNWCYGLQARIGISRFMITATYRLSDLFKKEFLYPELPKLSVGLQMGLYK